MSDSEPIAFRQPSRQVKAAGGKGQRPQVGAHSGGTGSSRDAHALVVFDRRELSDIFNVYGRRVAAGDWRDYAIDWGRESAVFSIFRRAAEVPIYRVVKSPRSSRRQGAYSIVTATGLILKRGHDLRRVLEAIDSRLCVIKS